MEPGNPYHRPEQDPADPQWAQRPGWNDGPGAPGGAPPQSFGQAGGRGPAQTVTTPPRGRPVLIALVAFLVELVLVVAFGNQAVSKEVVKGINKTNNDFLEGVLRSGLTFTWRFSKQSNDRYHVWLAELALLGAMFLLTFLLVLAVTRGPVTFGRAFFGTWTAVIAATMLGAFVRGLVIHGAVVSPGLGAVPTGSGNRVANAIWGPNGPSAFTFAAGLGLGLVVALITALVAVATRRPGVAGVPVGDAGRQGPPFGREDDAAATSELPSTRRHDQPGDRRPNDAHSAWAPAAAGAAGAGAGAYAAHEASERDGERQQADQPTTRFAPDAGRGEDRASSADQPTEAMPVAGAEHGERQGPASEQQARVEPPQQGSEPQQASVEPEQQESGPQQAPVETQRRPSDAQPPDNTTRELPRWSGGSDPWQPGGAPADARPPADAPPSEQPSEQPATRADETTQLPRLSREQLGQPPRFPGAEGQPVDPHAPPATHFPRPPNDEELGQHPE